MPEQIIQLQLDSVKGRSVKYKTSTPGVAVTNVYVMKDSPVLKGVTDYPAEITVTVSTGAAPATGKKKTAVAKPASAKDDDDDDTEA